MKKRNQIDEKAKVVAAGCGMDPLEISTRIIWREGWLEERTLGEMDCLEKWTIIRFTTNQTITLPIWMFFKNFLKTF